MAELHVLNAEPDGEGIEALIAQVLSYHADKAISGLAFAVVFKDGTTNCGYSDLPNSSTMLGAVERLRHRLVRRLED